MGLAGGEGFEGFEGFGEGFEGFGIKTSKPSPKTTKTLKTLTILGVRVLWSGLAVVRLNQTRKPSPRILKVFSVVGEGFEGFAAG